MSFFIKFFFKGNNQYSTSQLDLSSLEEPLTALNERNQIRKLAFGLTLSNFPDEADIFDTVADAYFKSEIKPVIGAKNVRAEGLGMGNPGDLGCLQALSYATLIIQALRELAGKDNASAKQVLISLSTQGGVKQFLLQHTQSLAIDSGSASGLVNAMIKILKLDDLG